MAGLDEIEKRAHARRVMLGSQGQPVPVTEADPLEEAMRTRERMVASQIKGVSADQVVRQMETENAELDVKQKKLRVEALEYDQKLAELESQHRPAAPAPQQQGTFMEQVLAALLNDSRESRNTLMSVLLDRRSEERRADAVVPPSIPTLEERLGEWEKIDQLIKAHGQAQAPASTTPVAADVDGVIKLEEARLRAEVERERLREDGRHRAEEHELRMQQIRADISLKQEEIAAARDKQKRMGDLVESLGPEALRALRESPLLGGAGVGAAAAAAMQAGPGVPVRCQNPECGFDFNIRGDEQQVTCPRCHQLHIRQAPPAAGKEGQTNGHGESPEPQPLL